MVVGVWTWAADHPSARAYILGGGGPGGPPSQVLALDISHPAKAGSTGIQCLGLRGLRSRGVLFDPKVFSGVCDARNVLMIVAILQLVCSGMLPGTHRA